MRPLLAGKLDAQGNWPKPGPTPQFSDIEIVALSLTAEYMSIDSERNLYLRLESLGSNTIRGLPERSRCNRRRRSLFALIEECRQAMSERLCEGENCFAVDSKPLEVVQFARGKRAKVCQENADALPAFGYCASKK